MKLLSGSKALPHRLVFLVLVLMDALDYGHSMDTLQTVLSALAAQLETNGMWRQAATVQMMNPVETLVFIFLEAYLFSFERLKHSQIVL